MHAALLTLTTITTLITAATLLKLSTARRRQTTLELMLDDLHRLTESIHDLLDVQHPGSLITPVELTEAQAEEIRELWRDSTHLPPMPIPPDPVQAQRQAAAWEEYGEAIEAFIDEHADAYTSSEPDFTPRLNPESFDPTTALAPGPHTGTTRTIPAELPPPPPGTLTTPQAAALIGCSTPTVRNRITDQTFTAQKHPARNRYGWEWRVPADEVHEAAKQFAQTGRIRTGSLRLKGIA
jgi:hypothetical protein